MTRAEEEALDDVRGYARAGRVIITDHASKRMRQRGAGARDVLHALCNAWLCGGEDRDRWRVEGEDLDGDGLSLVVVLEDGVVVVTMY